MTKTAIDVYREFLVWTCILLSSVVAGVATSSLEWLSPFGLNPRGRKRSRQYGLGSGLLMVWALVTGHTINIKAPKSWPSKVIQNVWAGLAIFIMTSYTANLAAYLAGQSAVISVHSIYDYKLLQKRVAVVPSSAVEHLLQNVKPDLHRLTRQHHVTSTAQGVRRVRSGEADIYVDDHNLLEYQLSLMDQDCRVKFVGKRFGSDGYAIGLAPQSWMRMPLSNKLLTYMENGFIQELTRKYSKRSQCGYFLSGTAVQYGLEHTGGLFIILLAAVVVSVLLLCVEHLAYRFLLPWLRSRPEDSFWKTEHMAFFSQRVYRVVRSEKLYSQKESAQEMIQIVRQRNFTRLLQKNELQKKKIPPQKRMRTKAEMLQEITSNIVSYNRHTKESDCVDDCCHSLPDDAGADDFITYDVIYNTEAEHNTTPTSPTHHLHQGGVNNLAYHSDDDGNNDVDQGDISSLADHSEEFGIENDVGQPDILNLPHRPDDDGTDECDESDGRLGMTVSAEDYLATLDDMDRGVRFSSSKSQSVSPSSRLWSSFRRKLSGSSPAKERKLSAYSVENEKTLTERPLRKKRGGSLCSAGTGREACGCGVRKDRKPCVQGKGAGRRLSVSSAGRDRWQSVRSTGIGRNLSLPALRKDRTLSFHTGRKSRWSSGSLAGILANEPPSPETRDPCGLLELTVPEHLRQRHFLSGQGRTTSDVRSVTSPTDDEVKHNAGRNSQVYQKWKSFQRSEKWKDQRVRPQGGRRALCRQLSEGRGSEEWRHACRALDAVSKEDLLLLWKASEQELQTTLKDVLHTNHHLALAIQALTHSHL